MKFSDSDRELLISEMFTMSLINTDLASDMIEECHVEGRRNE